MKNGIRACLLLSFFTSQVQAGEAELARLLEILKQNGTITEAQYGELIGAMQGNPQPGAATAALGADEAGAGDVMVSSAEGGVEVAAYDGESSFELGGRVMLDAARYSESGLGSGAEIRSARIELEGIYYADWGYSLGVEFAGNEADLKDAYLDYLSWYPARLRVGHFKEPFSLEELTSSKHTTFMERALPNVFAPGRSLGLGGRTFGGHWTLAGGVFAQSLDQQASNEVDQGWGLAGRVTYAPWHQDNRALHLGLSTNYRRVNAGDFLRFKTEPESHKSEVEFLDTGKRAIDDAESLARLGLEAAGVWGPFSLQGEYLRAAVARRGDASDLDFDGWYVQGSWFLSGESRHYKFEKGAFGRVHPLSTWGAWELAARYSTVDLGDGPIIGGRERNLTLGVNWYLNPRVRLMANYIRVENDDDARDNGTLTSGEDTDILQMRVQADF